jgi:hypothetical protein
MALPGRWADWKMPQNAPIIVKAGDGFVKRNRASLAALNGLKSIVYVAIWSRIVCNCGR